MICYAIDGGMEIIMKNANLIKSFFHAVCGFCDAFKRERNLRIHISVAILILAFAHVYGLDRNGYAVLILTITQVICAELLNSGIEKAVDTATKEYRLDAKHSKDFAAAATMVCAAGALAVGFFLFADVQKISYALKAIFTDSTQTVLFAALFVLDVFIIFYPLFMKKHKNS